jgi:hypothetical protein
MGATIQTDFSLYWKNGVLGQIADLTSSVKRSYCTETKLRFGQAVVYGTDPETQIKTPSATGQKFAGITVALWTMEQQLLSAPTTSYGGYLDEVVANIISRGSIWVRVNVDVTVNDPVYFVHTNVNSTLIGNFRNNAGTSEADLVPTGVFRKTAKAGELSIVEINLP